MQYVVRPGDSVSQILKNQGNPNWANPQEWSKLGLQNPNLIYPGQVLNIPSASASIPKFQLPTASNVGIGNNAPMTANQSPQTVSQMPPQIPQVQASTNGFQLIPTTYAAETDSPAPATKYNPIDAVSSPNFVNGTPDWVKSIIQRAADKHNISTMLLSALLKQESGFNPNAKSPVGALGIAQFMPATASGRNVNPLDPDSAINGAASYLSEALTRYGGDVKKALASYNAGFGNVDKFGGIPPFAETQNYVKNILAMAGEPHASANQANLKMAEQAKQQDSIPYKSPSGEISPLKLPVGIPTYSANRRPQYSTVQPDLTSANPLSPYLASTDSSFWNYPNKKTNPNTPTQVAPAWGY